VRIGGFEPCYGAQAGKWLDGGMGSGAQLAASLLGDGVGLT